MSTAVQNKLTLNKRNGEIDFLRFLFASIIMLHHSRYVLGDENCLFLGGSLAVEFYFLVSGYLLMASVVNANQKTQHSTMLGTETSHFLLRKIQAIFPEWLIAWMIGFIFVLYADQVHSMSGIYNRFMDYFFELTLLRSSGLHISAINGVMWYLSAMLICMAILYPLLRKYPDLMSKVICPLVAILLLGWLMQTDETLRNPHKWLGWTFKGNVRAMAELCLGVAMYHVVQRWKSIRMITFGRTVVTSLAVMTYGLTIRYMFYRDPSKYDFFYLVLLVVAVICSFSEQGLAYGLFQNRVSVFLGKYSTCLFFAHLYFAQHLNDVLPENLTGTTRLGIYVMLSMLNGLLVMMLASLWRRNERKIINSVARLSVQD